jgi:penicillin-binding protein 1C
MMHLRFSSWRRRLGLALLSVITVAILAAGALYAWLFADLPPVTAAALRTTRPTTQILDRHGRLLYEVIDADAGKQIDLALDHIPAACVQATIATEDGRFFAHFGVDPLAIGRAVWQNLSRGDVVSGGSTLTQQLARTLLLPAEERYTQSYARKLREAWLAWQLERTYSKDELLALYLNQTYYGNFAFGLEAAAQIFFAKPANQLSRAECALLAGLIQYPTGYNPLADPETAKNRQLTVLRLMREAGFLTAAEAEEVAAEPLRYRSHLFAIEAPHFVMMVQDQLVNQLGADRVRDGGLRVVTTLDLDLQRQAEQAVRRRLAQLTCAAPGECKDPAGRDRRVDNAAAVVLDSATGEILALVGSPDYFGQQISGNVNAALSLRQPGSAIKPFTYAAALDPAWSSRSGQPPLTAASILPDLPTTFYVENADGSNAAYRPQNYDRLVHGPVSVRAALANSYNIPAVLTLERIGVDTLRDLAAQAGIRTFTGRYGLALTLGGGDVRLLELTAAYGVFDDGRPVAPRAILEIGDWRLGSRPANLQSPISNLQSQQLLSPPTAWLITDILADNVARMPAFGANSVLKLPFPAAVKTGTTTDWRDNWTVGYSTERIVGVWVGNADNAPMLDVSGVDGAGPIWHDIMLLAHPTAPAGFTRPEGLVETEICAPSGLLPTPECPRTRWEWFSAGTQPTQPDDQFQRIVLDSATGQPATAATPAERQVSRVFWRLPPAYHDWMASQGIALAPASGATATNQHVADAGPLVLTAPASFTNYQLHPGAPPASQQLEVAGFTADGDAWHSLRLMSDSGVLATASGAARLRTQWPLQAGQHRFWLEGEQTSGGPTQRSDAAQINVGGFAPAQVEYTSVN